MVSNIVDVGFMRLETVAQLVRARQHTSREITTAYLDRIQKYNPRLNAYLKVFAESALAEAARADAEIAAGTIRSPIHGVPIAVKDIIDIAGHVVTAGGKLLPQVPAAADATVISRLRQAGAVILGVLNLHEYAWGGTTDNPHFGRSLNPWRDGFTPGGSSGGSGAAVAASLCAGAVGTDTVGSVRIPSSYCGCVGLKTTFGLVSTRGVYPLSPHLDTVGPLASSVDGAALLLQAMAGPDADDPTSAMRDVAPLAIGAPQPLAGVRLGMVRDYSFANDGSPAAHAQTAAVEEAVRCLVALGARRIDINFPEMANAATSGIVIALADGALIHREHLLEHPDAIGADVRTLLELGRGLSGVQVAEAHHQLIVYRHRFGQIMTEVDAIVTPTTPRPSHAFGEGTSSELTNVLATPARYAAPINLLGSPAVSVCCGFTSDGLPLALQIATRPFDEATALTIARAYESATSWHERRPAGFGG